MALAELRRWDLDGIEAAVRGLGRARLALLDLGGALHDARPPAGWSGAASDAARAGHERHAGRLGQLAAAATGVRTAVADAADAAVEIRRGLGRADDLAAALGFGIGADGTVHDHRQVVVAADRVAEYRRRRAADQAEIVAALERALAAAERLDADLAAVLDRAAADAADRAAAGLPAGPPPGGDPLAAAAWWTGLIAAEQAQVLLARPEWVGTLDGVPGAARDEANRALLAREIIRVDAELAAATAARDAERADRGPPGGRGSGGVAELAPLDARVEQLARQRAALAAVQATVAPDGRSLLLLAVAGHREPRAAVAIGDVDSADHVAVFTPGFTTTVAGSLGGYTNDITALRENALQQLAQAGRGEETVAGVVWLGYDAPQWDTLLRPAESVASPLPAQAGGRELAGFLDGLDASRPVDPHLTALGHSYGSTTTGYALQDATGVDDAVLFGSPGPSTGDLADLRVPEGHVGVVEARGDPTADLGAFGGDTNRLEGVVGLSAREAVDPEGRPLRESVGHSDYLSRDTTSRHNLAATVAGLPERRILGDTTDVGDTVRSLF